MLELAAAGLPSILVPYPHATGDHQTKNAEWLAKAGAAIVLPDRDLDGPRLSLAARVLMDDPALRERMSTAALALAKPDAAERIADEILHAV